MTVTASPPPADPARPHDRDDALPIVRRTVRELLLASPAYTELDAQKRQALARDMVRVCHAAATLIREEIDTSPDGVVVTPGPATAMALEARPAGRQVARAMGESEPFGASANRVAGTTRAILNAVSFPRFVTDLINGVFRAMLDSSSQQMESYVNLLNAVAASTEGF